MTLNNRTIYMLSIAGAAAVAAYAMRRNTLRSRDQHREETLDATLADTFPASDALPHSGLAQPTWSER